MTKEPHKEPKALTYHMIDALKAFKNRPVILIVVFLASIVIGIGTFTEAIDKILKIFTKPPGRSSSIGEMSQTPTPENRIGIWVARIRGDDDQFSAQRELVQNLILYLGKDPTFKNLVEVRELTQKSQARLNHKRKL